MSKWNEAQIRGITRANEINKSIPMIDQVLKTGVPPRQAKEAVQFYESKPYTFGFQKSIFFTGESGSGKTIAAVMAIIYHIEQWRRTVENYSFDEAIFVKNVDMMESIRKSYNMPNVVNDEGETLTASEIVVNRYKDVALLVIDDFGADRTTDWSYSMLYSILCHRYDWEKQIIFTSNYSVDEITAKLADVRLTNRIADWCSIVEMKGKDFRKK